MGLIISIICLAVTVILIPINMVGLTTLPWVVVFAPAMFAAGIGVGVACDFLFMLRAEKKNYKNKPEIYVIHSASEEVIRDILEDDAKTDYYGILANGAILKDDAKTDRCGDDREWGRPNEGQEDA